MQQALFDETQIFTVSELNAAARAIIERSFDDVLVKGEISNLKRYGMHYFFTLKDDRSQIRAVLFGGQAGRLRFTPRDGQQVLVRASLGLYEARGEFQAIVTHMEPLGIGALKLAYEELRRKLEGKGYFDPARKRPIPALPRCVGIVTSARGAALRDILQILRRRFENLRIIIFDVKVQGDGAAVEIADAIATAGERFADAIDTLIVGRGGGSFEDLFAFSEECVADAIFRSPIPVIAAVGHETDVSLADFVADLRAPTPSAAAELVVARHDELQRDVIRRLERLDAAMTGRLAGYAERLRAEERVLRAPVSLLRQHAQQVADLDGRIGRATRSRIAILREGVMHTAARLQAGSPRARLSDVRRRFEQLSSRCSAAARLSCVRRHECLSVLAGRLDALSPLSVLSRGYSIATSDTTGLVIKDAASVAAGERIGLQLARGRLQCLVETPEPPA